jgi:hypothetical protein
MKILGFSFSGTNQVVAGLAQGVRYQGPTQQFGEAVPPASLWASRLRLE